MKSFANAPSPVVASVVRERNVRDAIAAIRNSECAGATGIDLHLSCLDEQYKNVENIKEIISSSRLPLLALNYSQTYEYATYDSDEDSRIELLEMGAEAGASAVDMQGYSFNKDVKTSFREEYATEEMLFARKKPNEVALDPETVTKQVAFIEKMHAHGTEVLLSCHTGVYLSTDEAVSLCKYFEATRKPDIIKLVCPCNTDDELAESFRTMITLKKEISCKVHYHCSGAKGRITRIINPMLGAHLAFCIERFSPSANFEQLDLHSYVNAINTLEWRQ